MRFIILSISGLHQVELGPEAPTDLGPLKSDSTGWTTLSRETKTVHENAALNVVVDQFMVA